MQSLQNRRTAADSITVYSSETSSTIFSFPLCTALDVWCCCTTRLRIILAQNANESFGVVDAPVSLKLMVLAVASIEILSKFC